MSQRRKVNDPWVCTECGARTFGAWSKPVPRQGELGPRDAKRAQKVLNEPSRLTWPAAYRKAVCLLEAAGAVTIRGIDAKQVVLDSVTRELLCQRCYDRATAPLFGPPTKTELSHRRRSTLQVAKLPDRTRPFRPFPSHGAPASSTVVAATEATQPTKRREARRDEWERRQREIEAENRLAARLREESFQRELRDRRHREELALGGIIILGGVLGSKKP